MSEAAAKKTVKKVYLYWPSSPSGESPVMVYANCTDIENDGSILTFKDAHGFLRKTSLPWEVEGSKAGGKQ